MGLVTPLGYGLGEFMSGLLAGRSGVRRMDEWPDGVGLRSRVGAPLELRDEEAIPRRSRRTMSPMSIYAAQAADQALADAGLSAEEVRADPRVGCIVGHTTGSPRTITATYELLVSERDFGLLSASEFFQCLSHSAALNVAGYLGLAGTVMATSAACASGLQAVGAGADLIRLGRQDVMLCGGAEELHYTVTGSFDIMMATSSAYNDRPQMTPRPFDRDRDGLVCGEGAGILVLEQYARAARRRATIHGEVLGYDTCCSGAHVSQSERDAMVQCMGTALERAGLGPDAIDYVSAHATATVQGDAAEAQAIAELFGERPPVSSLKGYIGHTLGASGAIELAATLAMMRRGLIVPTRNLAEPAPDCRGIRHVTEVIERPIRRFIKNSFAFGGINAALVCAAV